MFPKCEFYDIGYKYRCSQICAIDLETRRSGYIYNRPTYAPPYFETHRSGYIYNRPTYAPLCFETHRSEYIYNRPTYAPLCFETHRSEYICNRPIDDQLAQDNVHTDTVPGFGHQRHHGVRKPCMSVMLLTFVLTA